ncbi:MAG: hypothetical protein V4731_15890 [Pseudomonadota bacterium]
MHEPVAGSVGALHCLGWSLHNKEILMPIIAWLLGVPLTLVIILWLLGIF